VVIYPVRESFITSLVSNLLTDIKLDVRELRSLTSTVASYRLRLTARQRAGSCNMLLRPIYTQTTKYTTFLLMIAFDARPGDQLNSETGLPKRELIFENRVLYNRAVAEPSCRLFVNYINQ